MLSHDEERTARAKVEFIKLVEFFFQKNLSSLAVNDLSFEENGYTIASKMSNLNGYVKIGYGPPEYHVELLIVCQTDRERWDLGKLAAIDSFMNWMSENRTRIKIEGKTSLQMETEWIFGMLFHVLRFEPKFNWIFAEDRIQKSFSPTVGFET